MIIYFTGFMGSGKSTMGALVADAMLYPFIDLDKYIEERLHIPVHKIFSHYGEYYFRQTETDFLHETANWRNLLLATGGGTPCHDKNMEWMKEQGLTVYLKASEDELFRRLADPSQKLHRPLIADLKAAELKKYIKDTLAKREVHYNKADIIFEQTNVLDVDVKTLTKAIQEKIQNLSQNKK